MACKRAGDPARHLFNALRTAQQPTRQCLTRSMATASNDTYTLNSDHNLASADPASNLTLSTTPSSIATPFRQPSNPFLQPVHCTLHTFPTFEPISTTSYPPTHLSLPLRKDLLHRAVIFEADAARHGTGSTKTRWEVHGSGRKMRPQKGTGKARLGDKKSPMLRGGGVSHGPKPRDFSTELPKKVYHLAFRTALSFRWRMGQLIVTESDLELQGVHENSSERYVKDLLDWNRFGKSGGKTLFVADERREGLFGALEIDAMQKHARARTAIDLSIKDLLLGARVVVERRALDALLKTYESDLGDHQKLKAWRRSLSDA